MFSSVQLEKQNNLYFTQSYDENDDVCTPGRNISVFSRVATELSECQWCRLHFQWQTVPHWRTSDWKARAV